MMEGLDLGPEANRLSEQALTRGPTSTVHRTSGALDASFVTPPPPYSATYAVISII